jgi:hypothetical protein
MTRRVFVRTALAGTALAAAAPVSAASRRWQLGINTYCLRFQRWNDRQLIDYCVKEKLDAIFLQDSLDPAVMEPRHWADVRAWVKMPDCTSRPAARRCCRSQKQCIARKSPS